MAGERFPLLRPEEPPQGEAKAIEEMVGLARRFLEADPHGLYRRGQHAKDTGCVRAEFTVNASIPPEAKFGVFREPRAFEAIIRFSNGSSMVQPDSKGDGRGMAIKLLHVDGPRVDLKGEEADTTQDFVMINNPVFAFPNAREYTRFFRIRRFVGTGLAKLILAVTRPQIATIGKAIAGNPIDNPLGVRYFSMSPYRLGPRAIKFSAEPQTERSALAMPPASDGPPADDKLFDRLADYLARNEASFTFSVQFQEDPERMPVEDATAEWKSQFYPVATVRIPKQDLRSEEMNAFRESCENLSFNPWHALRDHEPLGGINRLRKAVYHEISTLRRQKNRAVSGR